jgi:hypothetical protein
MIESATLHVFSGDVPDWVVAHSPEDAVKVMEETVGDKYDVAESGVFTEIPDDHMFALFEDKGLPDADKAPENVQVISEDENSFTRRATCRAWADCRGRCFLGSAEY